MRLAGLAGVRFALDEQQAKDVWKGAQKAWLNHDQLLLALGRKLLDLTQNGIESEVNLVERVAKVFHSGDKAHSLSVSVPHSLSLSLAHALAPSRLSLSLSASPSRIFR
jgi:hypothetical protein